MKDKIINSFDIWITAQDFKSKLRLRNVDNISLEGIARLRALILALAVQGKLVAQNPSDEPANLVLEKIAVEKEQLIKDGKIKKQNPLPQIGSNEQPFELPNGWTWTRLQNVTTYIQRGKGPSYSEEGSVKVISQKCIQWFGFDITKARFVDDSSLNQYQPERYLVDKDLLWNSTGTGTVGRVNVFEEGDDKRVVADSHVTVIRPIKINSHFLWCFLASPWIQSKIEIGKTDSLVSGSTNQVELNTSSVIPLAIPLPPLKEQHRIVAKVNELMALCDELEQQETNHLKSHQLLVETLLRTLTNAADAKEFQTAWSRSAQHFDDLFTTEDSIDQLKQTILQLAVMGKLVPQDPKDEPASMLLERIEVEKERLIKKDLIKQEKPLPAISEDEIPYQLPFGWQWCRMKDLCPNISSGSTPPQEYFKESGIPYLKVYNIRAQQIDFEYQEQFVDEKYHRTKLSRSILRPGDVIMNIVGPPLGKVAIIPNSYPEWNCNQAITFFQPLEKSVNKWIYTFLLAGTFLNYIELIGTAGQDNISVTKSKMIMVPLPPISEQFRIVQKVEELFALCDRLKERIVESQKVVNLMANSIVEHVA